jgi:hypothetical protein
MLEAQMCESGQSISEVLSNYIMTRPQALGVSVQVIEAQLAEHSKMLRELSEQVQRLAGLMETWMLREDTAPSSKRTWWHR